MTTRSTYQKKKVREVLSAVDVHLSAERVFDLVNNDNDSDKKVSKATVYRILNSMYENNEVLRIMKDNIAYYDGNSIKHHHFICTRCGVIKDVPLKYDESASRSLENEMGIKVIEHETVFYGLCDKCLNEEEN